MYDMSVKFKRGYRWNDGRIFYFHKDSKINTDLYKEEVIYGKVVSHPAVIGEEFCVVVMIDYKQFVTLPVHYLCHQSF